MIFLKPNSVSGEIMNLLDEANEKVIIVSPYCKFDKWYKLINKIKDLKSRGIEIEFYIRDNEPESYEQVTAIGIKPICIPNLHSKLYLNEKYCIVTSMNLLLSSEINSLELGYKTESKQEYNELTDFYSTYLNKNIKNSNIDLDWIESLNSKLLEKFSRIRIFENEGSLQIKTSSNNYDIFIWNNNNTNKLRISGIVSGKEFEYVKSIEKSILLQDLIIELINGKNGYYDSIWATLEINLKTIDINNVQFSESEKIVNSIIDFISKVEEIKDYCYKNRK